MYRSILISLLLVSGVLAQTNDPLPSWNQGATKTAILKFVETVTNAESDQYIPPAERIATFDNDGTLWAEQPIYFQFIFLFDSIKQMAPQHPEWKEQEPFKSVIAGDYKAVLAGGTHGLLELATEAHAGMTTEDYSNAVAQWLKTAKHPETGRLYKEMVYQPMLELLTYFRANGFKTFIVSGGGIDFMRVFTEEVYGIPPEQVMGTSIEVAFELKNDRPELVRKPALNFFNDNKAKPVGIHRHIGRRPIAAFGNSDGDLQMMQWTAAGEGTRFCLYVHHTDAEREWSYDRESSIGGLDKGLDVAQQLGWSVADMKRDWKTIYPALNKAE